jgi:predicted dehydrogenase
MVNAARKHQRVVQVGTQGRSGAHIPEVAALFRQNYVGKIHTVEVVTEGPGVPGFGSPADGAPPSALDYDMWLGPAPSRPYNQNRELYNFRWFWDYSGGQMTNLGAHDLDFVYLLMGVKGPGEVYSAGGRFALEDNGETPDTQDALLRYPGFTVAIMMREANAGRRHGGGTEFCGAKGSIMVARGGYQVIPDTRIPA